MTFGLFPPADEIRPTLFGEASFRVPPSTAPAHGVSGVAAAVDAARGNAVFSGELAAPVTCGGAMAAMAAIRTPLGAALAEAAAGSDLVAVFGDYDVDGVTSVTTLLFGLLAARLGDARRAADEWDRSGLLGAALMVGLCGTVPERREGYGASPETMLGFAEAGAATVVCCDNGTNALEAMRVACKARLRVLVIDHHPPSDAACAFWNAPPPGFAIVNPWLPGIVADVLSGWSSGPNLCACAVVAGVVGELWDRLGVAGTAGDPLDRIASLAAIATVADVMPLVGVNRGIVVHGLSSLDSGGAPPGLVKVRNAVFARKKVAASAVPVAWAECALDAGFVGFQVGPRLNACGRMGTAQSALRLLSSSVVSAQSRLAIVEDLNARRKQALEAAMADASTLVADALAASAPVDVLDWATAAADGRAGTAEVGRLCTMRGTREGRTAFACVVPGVLALFVSSSMGDGLAGLVSGRLAEATGLVTIAMSFRDSKFYVQMSGSGRVPPGTPLALLGHDVPATIVAAASRLSGSGGGHAAAFGVRVRVPSDTTLQAQAMRGFTVDCACRLLAALGVAVASGAVVVSPAGPPSLPVDLSFATPDLSQAVEAVPALGPFGRGVEEPLVHIEVGPTAVQPMGSSGAAFTFDPVGRARGEGLRMIGFASSFGAGLDSPPLAEAAARLKLAGGGLVGRVVRSFHGTGEYARGGRNWRGPRTEFQVEALVAGSSS